MNQQGLKLFDGTLAEFMAKYEEGFTVKLLFKRNIYVEEPQIEELAANTFNN